MNIKGNVTINNQNTISENSTNRVVVDSSKTSSFIKWITTIASIATIIGVVISIIVWQTDVKEKSLKQKTGVATERSIKP